MTIFAICWKLNPLQLFKFMIKNISKVNVKIGEEASQLNKNNLGATQSKVFEDHCSRIY